MRAWVVVVGLLAACPQRDKAETKAVAPVAPPLVLAPPAAPPFEVPAPTDPIVSVGRAYSHACAVRASGAVDCWGTAQNGCLEDCVLGAPAPTVWRATGVTDAVAIDTLGGCVLRRSGAVACLSLDGAHTFVEVPGATKATAVSRRCYISAGRVHCGLSTERAELVGGVRDAVAVYSTGWLGNSCARTTKGEVWCARHFGANPWEKVVGLANVDEFGIASRHASETRGCARIGEKVSCFYIDDYYENGSDGPLHAREVVDIPALTGVRQLRVWWDDDLVVEGILDGKVLQQVGDGSPGGPLPTLTDAKTLFGGCALRAQGSLVCWGNNRDGALAQPTTIGVSNAPPTVVPGLRDIVDIAFGNTKGYALTRAGQIFTWGSIDRERHPAPALMDLGAGPTLIAEIDAERYDLLCLRTANGRVWCETGNELRERAFEQLEPETVQRISTSYGNLVAVRADGTAQQFRIYRDFREDQPIAATLPYTNVVEAHASETPCVRKRDGAVMCPTKNDAYSPASALAVGLYIDCAVKGGEVWCRSLSYDDKTPSPQKVAGLTGVTDIDAARDYACAVHGAGAVSCWGIDEKTRTLGAPKVVIASGARDVEIGASSLAHLDAERGVMHADRPAGSTGCALMLDGTVQCWGTNIYGELGDGSLVRSSVPIGIEL